MRVQVLFVCLLLFGTRPSHAAAFDMVSTVSDIVERALYLAFKAGESVRRLHQNPLDDQRRKFFQQDMRKLSEVLREVSRRHREENATSSDIAEVNHRLVNAFEKASGKEHGAFIREALDQFEREGNLEYYAEPNNLPGTPPPAMTVTIVEAPRVTFREKPGVLKLQLAPQIEKPRVSVPSRILEAAKKTKIKQEKVDVLAARQFRQIDMVLGNTTVVTGPASGATVASAVAPTRKVKAIGVGTPGESSTTSEKTPQDVVAGNEVDGPSGLFSQAFDDEGFRRELDEDIQAETELAGMMIKWPERRRPPKKNGTDQLSADEIKALLDSNGKYTLLTIIACVCLSVWAFYFGLMYQARQRKNNPLFKNRFE